MLGPAGKLKSTSDSNHLKAAAGLLQSPLQIVDGRLGRAFFYSCGARYVWNRKRLAGNEQEAFYGR